MVRPHPELSQQVDVELRLGDVLPNRLGVTSCVEDVPYVLKNARNKDVEADLDPELLVLGANLCGHPPHVEGHHAHRDNGLE